jgi:hypothetical protein
MIFRIFATVFFFGFAILLGVLGVMRGLHRASIFPPPDLACEDALKLTVEDYREPSRQRRDSTDPGQVRQCA